MIKRRKTRTITVGNIKIGSDYPISIQSMTKTDTMDIKATVKQIHSLEKIGCDLIRIAIKNIQSAKNISYIKEKINIPLIADIHFDYRLALEAIKNGVDKIRINPGNIKKEKEINQIIDCASKKNIPIRIGINSGSLIIEKSKKNILQEDIIVKKMMKYLKIFQKKDFHNLIIALKSSDINTTFKSYKKMAQECDYPFHLGITSSGLPEQGIIKSSIGIGSLLLDGIGDTIRVSLTADSKQEIKVAKDILESLDLKQKKCNIIACPTCGRCQVNLVKIVKDFEKKIKKIKTKNITVAIMGCEVNGPGEAKKADIGIAFGKNKGAIFKKEKIIKIVSIEKAIDELIDICKDRNKTTS